MAALQQVQHVSWAGRGLALTVAAMHLITWLSHTAYTWLAVAPGA